MEGLGGTRVLAFAASNSSVSINRMLAEYAASLVPGAVVETLDIHDFEMPLYRHDREMERGVPELARAFLARIAAVDALIVSFAEHNGAYTAAFKNLFDWCSRHDRAVWQGKPMLLLATSEGARGAQGVLDLALAAAPHFGGKPAGSLSVPAFSQSFDAGDRRLVDPALDARLRTLAAQLAA